MRRSDCISTTCVPRQFRRLTAVSCSCGERLAAQTQRLAAESQGRLVLVQNDIASDDAIAELTKVSAVLRGLSASPAYFH